MITGVVSAPGIPESELIAFAAAREANSEDPLLAVVAEAERLGCPRLRADAFRALPGRAAYAVVDGKNVVVGGPRVLADGNAMLPPEKEQATNVWVSEGKTILYTNAEGRVLGALAPEDEIRPNPFEP